MQDDPLDGLLARTTGGPPTACSDARSPLFHVQVDGDAEGLDAAAAQAADDDRACADADVALYESLVGAKFSGVAWELFSTSLAKYATPILRSWLYTGEILAACARRGRPVRYRSEDMDSLRADRDEREELVYEAVARGLQVFRKHALVEGGWRPDGGASLKSYFVGAVVGEFGAVYDRWATERQRRPLCVPDGDEELASIPMPSGETPESSVIGHDAIRRLLAQVKDDASRTALFLEMSGYSKKEIGEHLHLSEGAVSMRLSRLRKNPPQQQGLLQEDSPSAVTGSGRENA